MATRLRKRTGLAALGLAALLGGCSGAVSDDTALAVWELDPDQSLTSSSTEFTALVTRLACNSGVTGTVRSPEIVVSDSEVVVTFVVSPGDPAAATCQGNEVIPVDVELSEPLGDRTIRDGACDSPEAASTVFCEGDGVRFAP